MIFDHLWRWCRPGIRNSIWIWHYAHAEPPVTLADVLHDGDRLPDPAVAIPVHGAANVDDPAMLKPATGGVWADPLSVKCA